jgi:hypothetical protein
MNSSSSPVPHDEITQRAHQIWIQGGRPEGKDLENWLQAEQELVRQREKMSQSTQSRGGNAAQGATSATAKDGRGQVRVSSR